MELSRQKRTLFLGAGGLLATLVVGGTLYAANAADVPLFQVDPFWPRPLEYPQILGAVTGVAVGPQDNVWIVTRRDKFTNATEIIA